MNLIHTVALARWIRPFNGFERGLPDITNEPLKRLKGGNMREPNGQTEAVPVVEALTQVGLRWVIG
jgi:hypothetical protein